jgi:hypothetical protein
LNRADASQETASLETETQETGSNTVPDTAPRQTAPQGGVAVQLLRRAGETRGLAAFKETAAATSIEQFSRLRHEADRVLGLGSGRRR